MGVGWSAAGDRQDSAKMLDDHDLLSLVGRYQTTPDWVVPARVEDVTNKNYQLVYPYSTALHRVFFMLS